MAIVERVEKRELIVTLGANEAPASYRWNAKRFLTNDEDGSDAAPPQTVSVPCTAEEAAAHIGASVVSLLADIAADTAAREALAAELDTERRARQALEAQLAAPAE
jgi:hypothetical protein